MCWRVCVPVDERTVRICEHVATAAFAAFACRLPFTLDACRLINTSRPVIYLLKSSQLDSQDSVPHPLLH